MSAASLPSLLMSTDPQASGRNGRGTSTAADAGPRLLRSLVRHTAGGEAGVGVTFSSWPAAADMVQDVATCRGRARVLAGPCYHGMGSELSMRA